MGYALFFKESRPGEYGIRLEFLEKIYTDEESQNYIDLVEETGAEFVCGLFRSVYFRKKKTDGEFELFSDNTSRIKQLNRFLRYLLPFLVVHGLQLIVQISYLFEKGCSTSRLIGTGLMFILFSLGSWGLYKIFRKRNQLKREQVLFE